MNLILHIGGIKNTNNIFFSLLFILFSQSIPATAQNPINVVIPDFQVNDNVGSSSQYFSTIAVDQEGNFVIAWMDKLYRNDVQDFYARCYFSNGNPVGDSFKVNSGKPLPAIVMDKNANFIIVWTDGSKIYAQRYNNDSLPIGTPVKVSEIDTTSMNEILIVLSEPSIGLGGSDKLVVTWSKMTHDSRPIDYIRYRSIHAQRILKDGTLQGKPIEVIKFIDDFDNWIRHLSVAVFYSGNFIIVWNILNWLDYQSNIYFQRFLNDGSKVTSIFR